MPRATLAHTGAGAELNSLIALLSTDPVSALQKLNPFARPAAPPNAPADDHTGLSASEDEGEAASVGKADSRQRRLAMVYEWEMDSASEGSTVGDDFEEVDWWVEEAGWIEGGDEGMDEEAVLEEKEQEQESKGAEIDDEWAGVWIVGIKEKKARGKKEDKMKAVAKQEVASAKTALAEKKLELAKELHSKAMENLQAEKEDKVDATDCFQPQSYSSKRQPPKFSPHRKFPPEFPVGRLDEVKDENAGSDVQQQYQQQAQQPGTNSEHQPPTSPHPEPKRNDKSKIPQRQTTSKQRPHSTGDIQRVVDPSIPTQRNMRPRLQLTFEIPPSAEQALTLTQLTPELAQPQQHQQPQQQKQQSHHAHPQPPPRFAYPTIDQQLTGSPTTQHQAAPRPHFSLPSPPPT